MLGLFETPDERAQRYAETTAARAAALQLARKAAAAGDSLAGSLSGLERWADEKLPGWDFVLDDEDDSDLDVWP